MTEAFKCANCEKMTPFPAYSIFVKDKIMGGCIECYDSIEYLK